MTSIIERHTADPREDAADALFELRKALKAAKIALPSLPVDWRSSVTGVVLVELGAARSDVITQLAKVIRKGAE